MLSSVARSTAFAPYLAAVSQTVPSNVRPVVVGFSQKVEKTLIQPASETHTAFVASKLIPNSSALSFVPSVTTSLSGTTQVRFAHTDVQVPDFGYYRREGVKKGNQSSQTSADGRKAFNYVTVAGGAVATAYAGKSLVTEFVSTLSASADVLALAKIEIKLSDIPEGKSATFKWRNKPLFVRHRTQEEIDREQAVDPSTLRDQQHDNERVQKPEWLILLG